MNTPATDAGAHFVAKWQRREPEMALGEVFCPPDLRPRFRAWGALVHELREAAFELSDERVASVKCQWWAEELLGLSQGRSRHPLGPGLLQPGLPWAALARALLEQSGFDGRPGTPAAALDNLRPLSAALAEVEAGLFGVEPVPGTADSIAVHLLLHRLPEGLGAADQARLPLNLLARHGLTVDQVAAGQGEALLRDWAGELQRLLPAGPVPKVLFRRLRQGFDRARLARLAAGRGFAPPPAPASLWRAWNAARAC